MFKSLIFLILILPVFCAQALERPVILYIGASHSFGAFGLVLEKKLAQISNQLVMESSCGSSPATWLGKSGYQKTICGFWKKVGEEDIRQKVHRTPRLTDEISYYRPDVVIVQLGTNIAASDNPLNAKKSVRELLTVIMDEGRQCIWIGPPDANSKIVTKEKLKKTNQLLISETSRAGCFYIDSLKMTKYPSRSKEGIHYPDKEAREWASKLAPIIVKHLQQLP